MWGRASLLAAVMVVAGAVATRLTSNGYEAALRILNHKWVAPPSCMHNLTKIRPITIKEVEALGPCPTDYEIIMTPDNFEPKFYVRAQCAESCQNKPCSAGAHCQNLRTEIVLVSTKANIVRTVETSNGCVCSHDRTTMPTMGIPTVQ